MKDICNYLYSLVYDNLKLDQSKIITGEVNFKIHNNIHSLDLKVLDNEIETELNGE
jgi:hypothetical protein